MAAKKKYVTTLEAPKAKTRVVRYDAAGQLLDPKVDDEVLNNAYVQKSVIEGLGNPAKIKVTIEAA
jgi:hypothetical protein